MSVQDYSRWLPNLKKTTLFQDIKDDELLALITAMQPKVIHLEAGDMFPPERTKGSFFMFLHSDAPKEIKPQKFKWYMPSRGEPGMLMWEIPSLSLFLEALGIDELFSMKQRPLPNGCRLMELSDEMLLKSYGSDIYPAQSVMLRNLMGILAQKVMDVRHELFQLKHDVDIYNMKEGDKEKLEEKMAGGKK